MTALFSENFLWGLFFVVLIISTWSTFDTYEFSKECNNLGYDSRSIIGGGTCCAEVYNSSSFMVCYSGDKEDIKENIKEMKELFRVTEQGVERGYNR